jgi:CRP-like cAMP-binding protein
MVERRIPMAFMAENSPFAILGSAAIAKAVDHCQLVTVEAGQFLFSEGDTCGRLHLLASGRIRGYRARDDGREQVVWIFDAPGEVFCLVAAFGGTRYVFSAVAITASRLYVIDTPTVSRLVADHPALGPALLTAVTRQTSRLVDLVGDLALRRVPERVARLLRDRALTEGFRRGNGAELDRRRFREDEVASTVGTVRVHVSRTLRLLARGGTVQLNRNTISIPDLRALERAG